jgi:hypothetical protein
MLPNRLVAFFAAILLTASCATTGSSRKWELLGQQELSGGLIGVGRGSIEVASREALSELKFDFRKGHSVDISEIRLVFTDGTDFPLTIRPSFAHRTRTIALPPDARSRTIQRIKYVYKTSLTFFKNPRISVYGR